MIPFHELEAAENEAHIHFKATAVILLLLLLLLLPPAAGRRLATRSHDLKLVPKAEGSKKKGTLRKQAEKKQGTGARAASQPAGSSCVVVIKTK